jgi:mycofactocin precursor
MPMQSEPTLDTDPSTLAVSGPDAVTDVAATDDGLVEDELLVEEISIDGMCGVY